VGAGGTGTSAKGSDRGGRLGDVKPIPGTCLEEVPETILAKADMLETMQPEEIYGRLAA
jgi:hypothetical protein